MTSGVQASRCWASTVLGTRSGSMFCASEAPANHRSPVVRQRAETRFLCMRSFSHGLRSIRTALVGRRCWAGSDWDQIKTVAWRSHRGPPQLERLQQGPCAVDHMTEHLCVPALEHSSDAEILIEVGPVDAHRPELVVR